MDQGLEKREYDSVAKALHWLVVLLLSLEFVIAWSMPEIRTGGPGMLIGYHMSVGILILAVVLFRFAWRLFKGVPEYSLELPKWQKNISFLTHYGMYALLVLVPLTGWMWASVKGWDVKLFNLFSVPSLLAPGAVSDFLIGGVHGLLASSLLALIGLHVGAALYHKYFKDDGIFESMLVHFPRWNKHE